MITFLADWLLPILLVVCALLLLIFVKHDRVRVYSYVVMAALTSLLVAKFLSVIWQPDEARPFIEAGVAAKASFVNNPGFPSDHVLLSTVAVLAVAAIVHKRWLTVVLALMVVLIAVGRVLALVHTPLDVIGGLICGLVGGIWYLMLIQSNDQKYPNRQK